MIAFRIYLSINDCGRGDNGQGTEPLLASTGADTDGSDVRPPGKVGFNCGVSEAVAPSKLKVCTACRAAWYCDAGCQKAH